MKPVSESTSIAPSLSLIEICKFSLLLSSSKASGIFEFPIMLNGTFRVPVAFVAMYNVTRSFDFCFLLLLNFFCIMHVGLPG